MSYTPDRGDVVWIDFDPQMGREQAGRRPALVLSPKKYNQLVGLAIFCPVTSKEKGYTFEVRIPQGLKAKGVILSDQVKSLDWRKRDTTKICSIPEQTVEQVLKRVITLIE